MGFADRRDAGRQLAERLRHVAAERPVIVALPRGGLPVAYEVARALEAPLDVVVVRKLGVPHQPELAMGALGEGGVRVLDSRVVRMARVTPEDLAAVEHRERKELERRAGRFRGDWPPVPLAGRTVVIVDDGIATGSTARAAVQVVRAHGAARVVIATPVAPPETVTSLEDEADEVVCVERPDPFYAIGAFYLDFDQTSDEEVIELLRKSRGGASDTGVRAEDDPDVLEIPVEVTNGVRLDGRLALPNKPVGVVVFAHGSGSSQHSPRNRSVARALNAGGLATLLFDLLTPIEAMDQANVFDIELLARRLLTATNWLRRHPATSDLPVGYFGASTGAAAALRAAAEPYAVVQAIVSRGGRPDLAGPALAEVRAPTFLIVGGRDHGVIELNEAAAREMQCECRLAVVPGATHLFEEPGALESVARLARGWFVDHLGGRAIAVRGEGRDRAVRGAVRDRPPRAASSPLPPPTLR